MNRRTWLSMTAAGVCGALAPLRSWAGQEVAPGELERRIGRVIDEYSQQGFHRTGTDVDRRSGDWSSREPSAGFTLARTSAPRRGRELRPRRPATIRR